MSDATEGDKSLGRSCGPWHCYTDDIAVIRKRRGRFEGTLITVLAEALSVTNGMNIIAHHTTPLVLYSVRQVLDHPADHHKKEWEFRLVERHVAALRALPPKDIWLVPAHVPEHWTLVAILWKTRQIKFHDSLNRRVGAEEDEQRVEEEVRVLLSIVEPENCMGWTWVSEVVS